MASFETAEQTYARWGALIDLIGQGLDITGTERHAEPGALSRKRRHGAVFSGDIRADLYDYLEEKLPPGLALFGVPNSGIEIVGPGVRVIVKRPAGGGGTGRLESSRRRRIATQLALFGPDSLPLDAGDDEVCPVGMIIIVWNFDPEENRVTMLMSAPSADDSWHWRDHEVDFHRDVFAGVDPDIEELDDPLQGLGPATAVDVFDESDQQRHRDDDAAGERSGGSA